jgi:hypothetical protein
VFVLGEWRLCPPVETTGDFLPAVGTPWSVGAAVGATTAVATSGMERIRRRRRMEERNP